MFAIWFVLSVPVMLDAVTAEQKGRPDILPFSFSKNSAIGRKSTVTCVVSDGLGPFRFLWTKDGKAIKNIPGIHVQTLTESIAAMTIESVAADDLGNYTCTVYNDAGSSSYSATLAVEGKPEIMPFSFSKNTALGQKATVSCVVSLGEGPFHFLWAQDGQAIRDTPGKHVKTLSENVAIMTIERIAAEDLGNYTCTSITLGQKAIVSCTVVTGREPFDFRWTHDGKVLRQTSTKYVKILAANIAMLTIESVSAEDVGNYTCTASNADGEDSHTAPLAVKGRPEIQPFSFSKSLSLGEKTTVMCGATTGKGPLSFHWSHNGADFGNSASRYVKVIAETIAALTIERVAAEHLGNYTCTVSNDIGSDSFSANLVVEGPPEVQPFFFSKNIALGQKALVNCGTVSGDGPFKFSWVQDGAKVLATSSKYVSTVADKFATLTIESVGAEDIGNYTCTVSNDVGSDSFTAPLVVKAPEKPVIMPYSFPKNVLLGQKTVVTCVAQSGTGPLEFVWKHNGRAMVDKSSRYVKMLTESISTMTIERLATEHLGNYSCTVSNGAGSDSFTAPLVVEDKPQIQPFSFPPNVNLGEKASVTCSATRGDGPFRFTWTQDGRPIVNTASKYARTVVDDIATMTIEKVSAEDVGNYTCTVSNGAGRDSASASLMVEAFALFACLNGAVPSKSNVGTDFPAELRESGRPALQSNRWYQRAATPRPSERPDIQPFSFSKNIALGQKASVACVVIGGSEPFRFEWTHNGKKIVNKASKYVRENIENMATVIIQKVSAEDVGNYTCTVSNSFGKDSHSAPLVVEGGPDILPFSFSKKSAIGQKSTVTCVVSGGLGPFRFSWTKDGQIVKNSVGRHVETDREHRRHDDRKHRR
ncbi:cell adhesion molecule, putative [Ixodes scapularis]|uniref:Cell adhesion molecule, putative n=1 Tax=Ixodes scapularis TaxID=6945 RepID=B7QG16_IXOSC|nr:cell adhesion molecule, putative [Ixodes scapularis]|eukprot:XP_002401098.1 cell adhesion molecule, putative [Ixodes scapularis]